MSIVVSAVAHGARLNYIKADIFKPFCGRMEYVMANKIRVTVWNEFRHEKTAEVVKALYPDGMHAVIAKALRECDDVEVRLAALDDEANGLPDEVLNETDVLIWWGHVAHHEVPDELAEKIRRRVYVNGMGFIALHSAHLSKPFRAIVGTTGNLSWGNTIPEVVWNINPSHPIAAGIPDHFCLKAEEVYAEPFQIPAPDEIVFLSAYEGGCVFRSGNCWKRGAGKVFYFQPGHETVPTYYNENVQRVLKNAVHWAAPADFGYEVKDDCPYIADAAFFEKD
jgi:trehalose utilization protein